MIGEHASMPPSRPQPATLSLTARGHVICLASRTLLMGVLNVTPDSFSDGGWYCDPEAAIAHATVMAEEGADLIDIGAESSRPGADPIEESEELRRLLPVVEGVCQRLSIPVSIDTTKAAVARRALDLGASIINDISALRFDAAMGRVIAEARAGVVLMHMKGTPKTMQDVPRYEDVVGQVRSFLDQRLREASDAGIHQDQILLDPGFGFGKTVDDNLALLDRLPELSSIGRPLVVGVSRKSFIGRVLDRPVEDRLMGTAAAVAVAVQHGARVVRVHDVAAMREVVRMAEAIRDRSSRVDVHRSE